MTADQGPGSHPSSWPRAAGVGRRYYAQEYCCSFESTVDAVFDYRDIQAALSDEVKPLFGNQ